MPCHPARARELWRKGKTSYRQPRFQNRTRPQGWTAPSLLSRVDHVFTWAMRPIDFAPVSGIVVETERFDTQLLQHPEISGVEYQQGELAGYEAREYLLEKWGRTCAYCGTGNVFLEAEHSNLSMFLVWAEDHGSCAGWITTVFLARQRKQEELSRDGKPGVRSRHWSTKAKSSGRMLAGCLCESPAVSIARQKQVQYRGFHGNIAPFSACRWLQLLLRRQRFLLHLKEEVATL